MLPASTHSRKPRDGIRKDGRGVEISRLIGRSLRKALDFSKLGERTITVDCDVLEADGGTRTASVTGAFVALVLCVDQCLKKHILFESPIVRQIAAVSVGIVDGAPVLDLCYAEDHRADVDMNVVMDEHGKLIEVQGTGENAVFSRSELNTLLDLAEGGIQKLHAAQREALSNAARWIAPAVPRVILATNNAHKVSELRAMLKSRYDALSLQEAGLSIHVEETGATFSENAALKAEAVARRTGCASLADDSGLMVDALDGAPGIFSARYAGEEQDDEKNNRLLLDRLCSKPKPWRAQFVSAVALARPGKRTLIVEGTVKGVIVDTPRGRDGFGYDPLFEYETGQTFAEMSDAMKNSVSHRGAALRALLGALGEEEQPC
jgi:XTP/dITP diphosphohydrolase